MRVKAFFDKRPETYLHYLMLTIFLFFFYYIGDYFFKLDTQAAIYMFAFWFSVITLSETIINYALNSGG